MRRQKFYCLLVALLMLVSLVIGGCSSSNSGSAGEGDQQADASAEVKDTLYIGITSDIANLDVRHSTAMLELRLYENLYDTLITYKDGEFLPSLAKSWDVSADGTEYTFYLEEGVLFHNGEELTSQDVVDTINSWPGTPNMFDLTEMIASAEVVDEYTVKITLNAPSAIFLMNMTAMGNIYSTVAMEELGDDYAYNPIGTGPYKFVEHKKGISVTFEAFDEYFKGTPSIKNVVFKIVPDTNTLVTALETHDVDFVYSIPVPSASIFEGNDEITLAPLEGIRINWLSMNNNEPPFDNKLVRQAVNYAINREFINDALYDGLSFPIDIMANKNMFGMPAEYPQYDYNPEKAKELLSQAGYPDGITLDGNILTPSSSSKTAEIIMQNLADIGITTAISQVEFGTYIQDLFSGNYLTSVSGYYMLLPDVDAALQMYKSTNIGAMNSAQYNNPEADRLMEDALTTSDPEQRKQLYSELYTILQEDSPYAIFSNSVEIIGYDSSLNIENINSVNTLIYDMSW